LSIEWDHAKNDANEAKHGLRFEEAAELIAIGPVDGTIIVVVYTERDDDVLRVISARTATMVERGMYEDFEKTRFR